jgi:tetratricopeptide (TPR) repeat protein
MFDSRRRRFLAAGVIALLLLASGLLASRGHWRTASLPETTVTAQQSATLSAPGFVGRATCAGCHAEQDRLWQGSHHDLAMQEANEQTVLGHFNRDTFSKDGVVSEFFRQDGRFMVRTDGADGKLADFEIKYTFGVTPLQQYLIELPGGRLQALSIAWDSRPQAAGGQRWFHLYPNEKIDHRDELHWTKLSQNWNFMCADCHSTDLKKNYDEASRGYHTTWAEIDVACEACHGPGSQHVALVNKTPGYESIDPRTHGLVVQLDERKGARWTINPESGNAVREPARTSSKEIETCARCHSRRGQWFADVRPGDPLMNSYLPAVLREGLYHADGQIDGEVYEYGSFLQSRMNHAGVTCSDCHEPHSLKLRAEGNGVCLQCHAADRFDTPSHHFHEAGSDATQCVECHMPAKHYMVVDPRRDHSFRIPRPDLSVKIGTPNACNQCHTDKSPQWAAAALRQRLGHDPKGYQDYAETLHAARTGASDAGSRLEALLRATDQPAIARATAAEALGQRLTPDTFPSLMQAMQDADPLVRASALEATDAVPPEQRWEAAHALLRDPVRVVRALAAETLADVPPGQVPSAERADLDLASSEYLAAQQLNADEPGSQVNLGNFLSAKGDVAGAEHAYREALAIDPGWIPAIVNLGDLYRQSGRDAEGESLLRDALERYPAAASLQHSLGLLLVRQKKLMDALPSLRKATELAPDNTRFLYVYAVALQTVGKNKDALKMVLKGLKTAPFDPGLLELRSELSR